MSEVGFAQEIRSSADAVYSPATLEARWQQVWRVGNSFATPPPRQHDEAAYVLADCVPTTGELQTGQLRTYTIADASARFLRARGRSVLFSLAFDPYAQPAQAEPTSVGLSPSEWAQRRCQRIQAQLQALGCSCDWDRAFMSSEPDGHRWSQRLFLVALERNLIYRRDRQWFMRLPYAGENEKLDTLAGWDPTAIAKQREAIGLVDGVEIQASTFGRGDLTVFTRHADAVANATFVAVSPAHPDIDQWVTDPAIADQLAAIVEVEWRCDDEVPDQVPMVLTDSLAIVPGVAGMLPIVISPVVDVRFGTTAILGIPELDPLDRAVAERLPAPAGTAWKTSGSRAAVKPAVRYRARDVAVSRASAWGTPIPVVDCPTCGAVPVPLDDLPVCPPDDPQITGDYQRECPNCGAAASREATTIDPRLNQMWLWMAICVPPQQRCSRVTDETEYERWLPVEQAISDVDAVAGMLERRIFARILQDAGELPPLPDGEPFATVLTHSGAAPASEPDGRDLGDLDNAVDLDRSIAQAGSDAVRLALLYSASRTSVLRFSDEHLHYCQRFLQRLYSYAEPRLREFEWLLERTTEPAQMDSSDRLRRHLAHWCAVACEKTTAALEGLELQRAVHNVIRLLTRIEDFERRVSEQRAESDALDEQAIVAALLVLVRLIAPLAPHIAEELWSVAGSTVCVSDSSWPTHRRPRRLAVER